MIKPTSLRLIRLAMLLLCLMMITSLMAQDAPVETPTDVPTEITEVPPTDVPTEAPTEIPTEAPVTEAPPTEAPVETTTEPTVAPVETETSVPVETVVTAAPTTSNLPPEPPLDLVMRELFQDAQGQGIAPVGWTLPTGWMLATVPDGYALKIDAAQAGLDSGVTLNGLYHNVAIMGYFTFVNQAGTAQLVVRESTAGAYRATLNAQGQITLEKRDAAGAVSVLGTAVTSLTLTGTYGLRLSAVDGVLRVSVDNAEVLAVIDAQPLPSGTVSLRAGFEAPAAMILDNVFLWQMASEIPATTLPPTQEPVTPVPVTVQPTDDKGVPPAPVLPSLPMAGLAAPVLSAPANNAIVTTLRPTFTWAAAAGANRYRVRVATEATCTTPVDPSFDALVMTTSFPAPIKLPQGEYWYCVESQNTTSGTVSGFIGEKRHFVVNIAKTPAQNAVIALPIGTTTTPFTWVTNTVTSYGLQIDDDPNFGSPTVNMAVPGVTFSPNNITYGVYYWRVNDGAAELPVNLAYKFTVTPPLPLASTIQTPAPIPSGGSTNDTTPLLDWTVPTNWVVPAAGQSITYELDLSTNATFTALVAPTVTGLASSDYEWAATLPNTPGTVYYWRVRTKTNLGLYGAYSPTYNFKLDTVAPNAPASLTAPANNVVSTSARPSFSWATAAATGATSYLLDLSSAADLSTLDFGSPFPSAAAALALPASLPQGTAPIYWQVRAKDAAGNISAPSVSRALIVDYAVAPANDTVKALTTPTGTTPMAFSWTAVTGLTGAVYNVSIFSDAGLATQVQTSGLIATAAWTSPALTAGEYWWTLSVTGKGTSSARRFVITPPLPGAPVAPFVPAASSVTNNVTPMFNWGTPTVNPTNLVDYELQLSTVNTFTAPVAGSPYIVTNRPFTITTALPMTPGQVYYWRVRARTALNVYGPFTATQAFTLDTTPPNAPLTLAAPADNAILTVARPTFSWAAITGATRYKVEIARDNGFGDIVNTGTPTTTSYVSTTTLAQGTYFWRVWSQDAASNESTTPSVVRTFVVDYRAAPAVNATTFTAAPVNVAFTWTLATGAPVGTTYKIEIDDNFDGNSDTNLPAVTTATLTVAGIPHGKYQYRLVASNTLGTSGWRTFIISPLLPGAPAAPFAPVNGSFTNTLTPTLQWSAPATNAANVAGYSVEVATTSNFTTPIVGSPFDTGAAKTLTLPALTASPGQVYYWRVRARTALGLFSVYSATQSFTLDTVAPPAVTALTAPADNALTTLPKPTFSWGAVAGVARYKIQIDTDNGFANPVFIEGLPTTASFVPTTPVLQQGTYFWRVWSMDTAGNLSMTPSPVRTLVVNYPLTPADGAVVTSATATHLTFTWTAISGTVTNTIRIEVDNNSNFSSPERRSPLMAATTTTYTTSLAGSTPSTAPLPAGKYYWRMLVTGHTNPSSVRTVIISPPPPAAPVLSTVTPAANTTDTMPNFSWNAVVAGGGVSIANYEFQLSTVSTFATLVGTTVTLPSNTTTLEWSPALPDTAGQTYYAHVRAVTNLGAVTAWSTTRSFTLDTQAPVAPTLTAPANNATVTNQKPTFQWAAVAGATQYDIRYGTQANLSGTTPIRVTSASHVPAANLLLKTYFWEVRAIDAAGNVGAWSGTFSFSVSSAPNAAPSLWSFAAAPTLTWTPIAWAESYEVQVSNSPTFGTILWQTNGIVSINAPSATVGVALTEGTYYWRVRAKMPAIVGGQYGPYSTAFNFTIEVP